MFVTRPMTLVACPMAHSNIYSYYNVYTCVCNFICENAADNILGQYHINYIGQGVQAKVDVNQGVGRTKLTQVDTGGGRRG